MKMGWNCASKGGRRLRQESRWNGISAPAKRVLADIVSLEGLFLSLTIKMMTRNQDFERLFQFNGIRLCHQG